MTQKETIEPQAVLLSESLTEVISSTNGETFSLPEITTPLKEPSKVTREMILHDLKRIALSVSELIKDLDALECEIR